MSRGYRTPQIQCLFRGYRNDLSIPYFARRYGYVRHLSAQMSPVQTGANESVMFRNVPIIFGAEIDQQSL